ncbi:MAG: tRNA (N(6)-L-threonylcarbamoyladenosine(37)-C(2))-methylthiotransferase MtaB [Proteobacteria bacterium]|nr:tRNA (N(6)-L-threonylcarbamoyladenosine(37)-C(2))-methylthiotransferase MtaB [Pseudomonadota bacterium]MBU4298024.1 tRNA (N(6)-L-threonylcarbamoyladenosine(37)-C(2))-methylthiotransferase MtaB [Pseudomonadota bacterium]MCG2749584.1 tRNA (N(6)-L-threonylcarbamoyladenosine(37)-C(2))-methylthiotransferase MtaB [Desulfobulbaceae bacterium]
MTAKKKTIKVALTTLGCKVNQFESASFLSGLVARGAEIVPFSHQADIYIINTCAVTGKAGAQSRQMIRRALKTTSKARLVVTGCYAQVATQKVLEIGDWSVCIVGNGYKHRLVDIALSDKHCDLEMHMGDIGSQKKICPLPVSHFPDDRTRSFLKIQDGCNNFCSYCIVPYARGRSRSLPIDAALQQISVFAASGYKEIVLTGIHVGMYGLDLSPPASLLDFIDQATANYPAMRFRLSSLEPGEVQETILDLMAARANFMPHLHIPLQSGDDRILREMNRRYQADDFARLIGRIREKIPHAAIGVDVLVGFPNEDDGAFNHTYALLADLPVTYLHVFPYSKRPGTVAAGLINQIPGPVKDERVARLRLLSEQKKATFYQQHLGTTQRVLAENKNNRYRLMRGFTENYIPVLFPAQENMSNQIVDVFLDRLEDGIVFGRTV